MTEPKTYFDFSCQVKDLLFKGVSVSSVGEIVGIFRGFCPLKKRNKWKEYRKAWGKREKDPVRSVAGH